MTDTSKDAVDRLVLFMVRSGNTTAANMLTALADERDAANARADQARDAALVEAAGVLEAQALDADAQAKRFRGGSDTWADRTARSRALRNSATAILALRDKPAPAVTVQEAAKALLAEWQDSKTTQADDVAQDEADTHQPDDFDASKIVEVWLRAIAGGGDE